METDFIGAVTRGDWPMLIGLFLMAIAPSILYMADGKVSEKVQDWLSLTRSVAIGMGSGMVAVAGVGGPWWVGVLTGLFGLFGSQGFLDLIKERIQCKE